MENTTNNIIEKLIAGDSTTWSQFLFNIDMAKSIAVDKNVATALLTTGVGWSGDGWTTGSASKKLWETVKIPLVVPDFKEYLHVWLFTLAMHWDIEVPALNLSAPAADASFQLLELLHSDQMETDGNTHHVCDNLPWEEQLEDLPKELLYLLQKASTGDRLDLSEALKEVPRWSGLPTRAPENNHRQTKADRDLRSIQQALLHGLRLLAWAYLSDTDITPWQITWKHFCDTFYRVEFLRKELGMPGSTTSSKDVLYNKDDLQQAAFNNKVRTYRTYRSVSGSGDPLPQYSFRTSYASAIRNVAKGKGKGKSAGTYGYSFGRPALGRGYGQGKGFKGKGRGRGMAPATSSAQNCFTHSQVPRRARSEQRPLPAMAAAFSTGLCTRANSSPCPLSRQAEKSSALVAASCKRNHIQAGLSRPPSLPAHPSLPVHKTPVQEHSGAGRCHAAGDRVPHHWSSQRGRAVGSPPPHSMVCNYQGGLLGGASRGTAGRSASLHSPKSATGSTSSVQRQRSASLHVQGSACQGEKTPDRRCQRAQHLFLPSPLQNGPLGGDIPPSQTGLVVHKNGPPARLFSSGVASKPQALRMHQSRGKSVSVSRSSLWDLHHTPLVDQNNGNFYKTVESKRDLVLCLSRRHSCPGSLRKVCGSAHKFHATDTGGCRYDSEQIQVHLGADAEGNSSGVLHRFGAGSGDRPVQQVEAGPQGSWKSASGQSTYTKKVIPNIGRSPFFSAGHAISPSFYGSHAGFCQKMSMGVGHLPPYPRRFEARSEGPQISDANLERKIILSKIPCQNHPFRQLRLGLGRCRLPGIFGKGFLEEPVSMAHKHKRAGSQC